MRSDDFGAPMDMLWFRVTRRPSDPAETFGRIDTGAMLSCKPPTRGQYNTDGSGRRGRRSDCNS
jgi:hypothetical protein